MKDAQAFVDYFSNENVYRYLPWKGPGTVERSCELINIWNKDYNDGWIIRFAIADKETDKLIGTIFLSDFEGRRAEIGYELSESYWRRGIMTEAVREVLSLGLERIQAYVSDENSASTNALKKFNFTEEGFLKKFKYYVVIEESRDMWMYGLLDTEFEKKNA